ncbi:prolipoprotein diacylglyceryl transferase [bacterium]|nr:prolipoprotein diacylglyceryl transferase [bacterium]
MGLADSLLDLAGEPARMHPQVFGAVSVYFLAWAAAAVVGVATALRRATVVSLPLGRSFVALICVVLAILLGSRLLYLAEASWFPADDYVPPSVRGALHGFRIPGGILALALTLPLICRVLGLPWTRFGDRVIPLVALAVVFIRLGCFMNGCCFGQVSSLPWAVRFPRGTWAFWYHATRGWVPPGAATSLPVQPLQLYFLGAAAFTFAVLLWLERRSPPLGMLQVAFFASFFLTTAVLEPLRENFLTLNQLLAPVAAAGSILVGVVIVVRHARLVSPPERGTAGGVV